MRRIIPLLVSFAALTLVGILAVVCGPDPKAQINPVPNADSDFLTDLQTFLQEEDADREVFYHSDFISMGCLDAVGAGLTHNIASCVAFVEGKYTNVTGSITYPASDTCWVALDDQATGTPGGVGNFSRVAGTNFFLDCVSASQPSPPTGTILLYKATTDATSVTAVSDLRVLSPHNLFGQAAVRRVTQYGAACDGVTDDTAAVQAAINDLGSSTGGGGIVYVDSNCVWNPGGITWTIATFVLAEESSGSSLSLYHPTLPMLRTYDTAPAAGGDVGRIEFWADDSNGNASEYAHISGAALSITGGMETGQIQFFTAVGGPMDLQATLDNGTFNIYDGNNAMLWLSDTSAATSETVGKISFRGRDSINADTPYAEIETISKDVLNGSEDGSWVVSVMHAGTMRNRLTLYSQTATFENYGNSQFLELARDSVAAGDLVGRIGFRAPDSASNTTYYSYIDGYALDPTDGTEDGEIRLSAYEAGTPRSLMELRSGNVEINSYGKVLYQDLVRDTTPDGSIIGRIRYKTMDSAFNVDSFADMEGSALDTTSGSEDGRWRLYVTRSGVVQSVVEASASTHEVQIQSGYGLRLESYTQATLPAFTNGTIVYCSDCNQDATCSSGGSGALAARVAGAWDCTF